MLQRHPAIAIGDARVTLMIMMFDDDYGYVDDDDDYIGTFADCQDAIMK